MPDDKIPLRTEVTVLGPDDPKQKTLGFVVREYDGVELHPLTEAGGVDTTKTFKEGELQVGMKVALASLFGGYNVVEIRQDEKGEFYGINGGFYAFLKLATDERACWVSPGGGNLRAIKKLTANSGE